MILYHGSYLEIQTPDLVHSRKNVDFGRGFYTTPLYGQAVKWCEKFMRRGKSRVISRYSFDEKAYQELKILKLKPNLQICFRTQKALDEYLHYEGSEQI